MSHIVTMNNITGDAPVSGGGGPVGEQIGSGTQTSDAMITYTVSGGEWEQGTDYDEAGRPFKLIRTGLGDVATASSTGDVTYGYDVIAVGTVSGAAVTATGTVSGDTVTADGTISGSVVNATEYQEGGTTGHLPIEFNTTTLSCGDNAYTGTDTFGTFFGQESGRNIASGFSNNNTAVGYSSLTNGSGGVADNTAVGSRALDALENGISNTALGADAGGALTIGSNNTMIGAEADVGATGTNQTAIGYKAVCTTNNEIVMGGPLVTRMRPMSDSTCDLGTTDNHYKDLHLTGSIEQGDLTGRNVAIGIDALKVVAPSDPFGTRNVSVGIFSGDSLTTGQNNTFTGYIAGSNTTTGDDNTCIGYNTQVLITGDNQTAVGSGATCTDNNQIVLGDTAVSKIRPMSTDSKCDLGDSTYKWGNITTGGYIQTTGIAEPTTNDGRLYYDSTYKRLRLYDGAQWLFIQAQPISGIVPVMTAAALPSPFAVTASTEQGIYPAWQAFDQSTPRWVSNVDTFSMLGFAVNNRTLWGTTQNMEWIKVDMGETRVITSVDITCWAGGGDRSPAGFDILVSNDDVTATTIFSTVEPVTWTTNETKNFVSPGTGRYLAILVYGIAWAGYGSLDIPNIQVNGS